MVLGPPWAGATTGWGPGLGSSWKQVSREQGSLTGTAGSGAGGPGAVFLSQGGSCSDQCQDPDQGFRGQGPAHQCAGGWARAGRGHPSW